MELKLTNSISLIKFENNLTQEEKNCTHNQYHYVDDVKVGDYVKFDMGNDFYKLVDGCITKPSLSINNAIALIKILKEEK